MSEIATLIGTLGFPIVCAIILAYIVKYMFDKYTNDINHLTDTHKQESDKFTEALNANTAVLNKVSNLLHDLVLKIGEDENDVK